MVIILALIMRASHTLLGTISKRAIDDLRWDQMLAAGNIDYRLNALLQIQVFVTRIASTLGQAERLRVE